MALVPGTRVGPYEITAPLGVGGMGEVYRATDAKLKRQVALKVLPEAVARDPDRLARFQREAELLAQLNHPHIAAIYGLEDANDTKALVMELVDGPTLADRIAQGALPVDEALRIAVQVAAALEAAHECGIVHRDLKPANIKIRADGAVKVLDFGLAKAMAPATGSSPQASMPPTITSPAMTQAGVILGTAAYMSPEQARGGAVDTRTDLWAFGAVLYEALTGQRAFAGETVSDAIASVLAREPEWPALPPEVPAPVVTLLRRCLNKDRKQRLDSAAAARLELEDLARGETHVTGPHEGARSDSRWRLVAGGLALVVVALALGIWALTARAVGTAAAVTAGPVYRSTIVPDVTTSLAPPTRFAVSPDGTRLVLASGAAGQPLRVRALDGLTEQALAGTEGGRAPFWSPDGSQIGFSLGAGGLKRVSVTGGPVLTLADSAELNTTAAWSRDGQILFQPSSSSPIFAVSAGGGVPRQVTTLDAGLGETQHAFPAFLPDGRFLFTAFAGDAPLAVYAGALNDASARVRVLEGGSNVAFARDTLFFVRGSTLVAQPFDVDRAALTGEAVPIAEPIQVSQAATRGGAFSVSEAGVLVYHGGTTDSGAQLTWYDRTGKPLGVLGDAGRVPSFVQVSPRGDRVAATYTAESGDQDIWILDVARPTRRRFTSVPGEDRAPAWSPDGNTLYFSARRDGRIGVYRRRLDGSGGDELLYADDAQKLPYDVTPDGELLLYTTAVAGAQNDIWALRLSGDRKPFPLIQSPFDEDWPQVSPDGRWLAYGSNETGRFEVYVAPFMRPGGPVAVSTAGADEPRWSRDGHELFFRSGPNVMVSSVTVAGDQLRAGEARPLIEATRSGAVGGFGYAVSPDNQRFLTVSQPLASRPVRLPYTLLVNWPAMLRR